MRSARLLIDSNANAASAMTVLDSGAAPYHTPPLPWREWEWPWPPALFFNATVGFTPNGGLDYHAPVEPVWGLREEIKAIAPQTLGGLRGARLSPPRRLIDDAERSLFNNGVNALSKSQDAKKNVKKAAAKSPKEKKEATRLKKAERKH